MDRKLGRMRFGLKASLLILMVTLCVILPIINVEGTPLNWPSPTTRFLRSVFMVGAWDGWTVGDGGIVHWNGTSWSNWQSPTYESLKSVYMLSSSNGWAVGALGTIVHWDGTSWSNWQSPITNYTLLSVYMLGANDGWAVGTGGTIVHWDGTSWSTVPSPITEQRLFSVFMEAPDNIWAVGDGGTIIHSDATSWSTVPSPITNNLYSVFMVSASDGWAVGDGGTIVHWDGTSWSTVPSPTTSPLYSVFMVSASDGWSVGSDGTIIHWRARTDRWSTPAQLTDNTANDYYPYISGDGSKIAFQSVVDGDSEIFVVNSDGSGLTQLTSNTANDRSTSISGDGGKIAFASDVDGDYEIFVVNSDGSGLTQLTSNTANEYYPHISGDGSKVAFYSDRDGDLEIFVGNSDGSGLKQLTFNTAGDWMPSISGDGGKIAFNSDIDGDSEIFVGNSDGSGLKQLTFNTANDCVSYDSISGDGGKIAFASDVDGDYEIFVVNSDGSGLTQLTSNTADDYHHSISGDGCKIAFSSDIDGDYEIWVISAQVQLTIEVVGLGTTNPAPDSYFYDSGTMVLVDSQPEVGWRLDRWLLDGSDVSHDDSYTVTMDADHTLSAVFEAWAPPVASFTYSPSAPEVGETVSFDASGSSDDDGYITSYAWDFGDENSGTGKTTSHAYATVASYTVTLTVTDNDGLTDTATKGFDVYAGPQNDVDVTKPHADARTSDQTVEVGTTVTCDASGCSDNVGVVSYEWDFGDGTTETGVIATHTYTEEGTYTVALMVRDAAGNSDTDTLKITVGKAAAPFPLWVLAPIIGGITGGTAVLVYLKRRKPKEEVPKPAEPIITAEPTEIPVPAKKTEEILKPPEEIPPQKVKEFPKLSAKCSDTIALLNSFIEDPSRINDRKAWKGFREFVAITEQIEDEYAELLEIRNKLAVLRRKRNEYRSAGLDDLADKTEGVIQSNYGDSIRIIKEIREKLPQLGG